MTTATESPALADAEPRNISPEALARAQEAFTEAEPRIRKRAEFRLRGLQGHALEDGISEVQAFAWTAFRNLTAQGRDPARLVSPIVDFAVKRFRAGRRFAGKVHAHDALADESRHRNGHFVTSLPHADDEEVAGEVRDALRHRVPGPAEEAICRMDWQDFLNTLSDKQREVSDGLESGLNLREIAELRGTSKAATQQVRDTLAAKWAARDGYAEDRGR